MTSNQSFSSNSVPSLIASILSKLKHTGKTLIVFHKNPKSGIKIKHPHIGKSNFKLKRERHSQSFLSNTNDSK